MRTPEPNWAVTASWIATCPPSARYRRWPLRCWYQGLVSG